MNDELGNEACSTARETELKKMAGVRIGPSQIILGTLLVSGCIAFINRKKFFPEVFERNAQLRRESRDQAIAFKDEFKKRRERKED